MVTTVMSESLVMELLKTVPDPEIPVISIVDLGVIRHIEIKEKAIIISITPTYSGCPALKAMQDNIISVLKENGITEVSFRMVYKPAWTTDWLSEETKNKLENYGIAPPREKSSSQDDPFKILSSIIPCSYCKSSDTQLTSRFSSTACKALHFCNNCHQPFEHFKCH
jgi:ring-1,2-phenylacetyl-CoA epoxidase subunit PaaD